MASVLNIYGVKSVTVERIGKRTLDGYYCDIEVKTSQGDFSISFQAETRKALNFIIDAPEAEGIWSASKMPTCPKCGWPPMADAENTDQDENAPIVCGCAEAAA